MLVFNKIMQGLALLSSTVSFLYDNPDLALYFICFAIYFKIEEKC